MPSSQHARVALLELADRGPESVIAAAHELPDVGEDGIGLGELAVEIRVRNPHHRRARLP